MVNRKLTSEEITHLALIIALRATPDSDLKKMAHELFDIYEKCRNVYLQLSDEAEQIKT